MKKVLNSMLALALLTGTAYAQQTQSRPATTTTNSTTTNRANQGTTNGTNQQINGTNSGTTQGTTQSPVGSNSGTNQGTMNGTNQSTNRGTTQGTMNGTTQGTMNGTNQSTNRGTTQGTMNGTTQGTMNGTNNGTNQNTMNGTNGGTPQGTMNGSSQPTNSATMQGTNANGTMQANADNGQANNSSSVNGANTNPYGMSEYDYTVQQYYDRMDAERLGTYKLSADQRAQLNTINSDYDRNMRSVAGNSSAAGADDINNRRNTYRSERRKRYMEMLSPADRTSFQSYSNDWNYDQFNWSARRSELNLTEDQFNTLNQINEKFTRQEAAIISSQSLTDAERTTQLSALRNQRSTLYNTILSADQVTKLKVDDDKIKVKTKTGTETKKVKTKTKTAGM